MDLFWQFHRPLKFLGVLAILSCSQITLRNIAGRLGVKDTAVSTARSPSPRFSSRRRLSRIPFFVGHINLVGQRLETRNEHNNNNMSAATEANNDPLSIFGEASPNAESTESSYASHNPFDPLGGSKSSKHEAAAAGGGGPLDLMSQISSWGAQNQHEEDDKPKQQESVSPSSKPKANVMMTKENAIELSDDLVAEAHREFEATEDKLRQFEQEQGPTAQ